MRNRLALLVLLAAAALGRAPAAAAASPREVAVVGGRVRVCDVVPNAGPQAAGIDLGPSPSAGGSRLVTRADILSALEAHQVPAPPDLPDAVRVSRKARHLDAQEMDGIVRSAIDPKRLGRGVALRAVRANRSFDVAEGWTRVEVDVPRAPKKAGPFATVALASFFADGEVLARVAVPVELAVSEEGALYDASRGAPVTLIVRRSFVEVRAAGFAAADADVGDPIPVQLRPSGRVVRARLLNKDEALALEGPQ